MSIETEAQADQRIILSRRTLHAYQHGGFARATTLKLFEDELVVLEKIAAKFPAKAEKLARLCEDWRTYIEVVRRAGEIMTAAGATSPSGSVH